jgi:hypothetical protein
MKIFETNKICVVTEATDKTFAKTRLALKSFMKTNPWFDGDIVVLTLENDQLSEYNYDILNREVGNINIIKIGDCFDLDNIRMNVFKIKADGIIYFTHTSLFLKNIESCLNYDNISSYGNERKLSMILDRVNTNFMFIPPKYINDYTCDLILNEYDISVNVDDFVNKKFKDLQIVIEQKNIVCESKEYPDNKYSQFIRYSNVTSICIFNSTGEKYRRISSFWININKKYFMDDIRSIDINKLKTKISLETKTKILEDRKRTIIKQDNRIPLDPTPLVNIQKHNKNIPIHVYYHIGAIDIDTQDIVDEQMKRFKDSGLYDQADKLYYSIVGDRKIKMPSKFKCIYSNSNYNVAELPILEQIKKDALNKDFKCLYFHTKGSSANLQKHIKLNQRSWRRYMEYFNIDRWKINLDILETYDTSGASLVFANEKWYKTHYAGNFWWANSSYIRNISDINDVDSKGRYKAEMWILSNYKEGKHFNWHQRDIKIVFKKINYQEHFYKRNTAAIVHVHYEDVWNDMRKYLKNIENPHDLYITISDSEDRDNLVNSISKEFPTAYIKIVNNINNDIGHFIDVVNYIIDSEISYDNVIKIHTKKSILHNPAGGEAVRNNTLDSLLGSTNIVNSNINILNSGVGMIGCKKYRIGLTNNDKKHGYEVNRENMTILLKKLKVKDSKLDFFGGTMFWIRWEILEKYFKSSKLSSEFFNDPYSNDGRMAHAMERVFACLVRDSGNNLLGV